MSRSLFLASLALFAACGANSEDHEGSNGDSTVVYVVSSSSSYSSIAAVDSGSATDSRAATDTSVVDSTTTSSIASSVSTSSAPPWVPVTGKTPVDPEAAFWTPGGAYNPSGTSPQASGEHNAGKDCMSCHDGSDGEAPKFLFGGTVYNADGTTGAAHVQVAVTDGATVYYTYSGNNGNFWVTKGSRTLNFSASGATAKMRDSYGYSNKPAGQEVGAGCNASACHGTKNRLIKP